MKFDLLKDEVIVAEDRVWTLTNQRLRVYNGKDFGSVLLQKVSGIEISYQEKAYWLVIAILCGLYGTVVFLQNNELDSTSGLSLLLAIVTLVLYLSSRKHSIVIGTDSGIKLTFATVGINREVIEKLIFQIEQECGRKIGEMKQE